jgi:hypothetical protein
MRDCRKFDRCRAACAWREPMGRKSRFGPHQPLTRPSSQRAIAVASSFERFQAYVGSFQGRVETNRSRSQRKVRR